MNTKVIVDKPEDFAQPTTYPPARLAWTVWGLGAVFYLIGFYQRVAPAVITTELMNDFGISAAALGNLSAFYFYSYVALQIPTGILADSWGPRRLLAWGSFVAGLGTLLFAIAPTFIWASLGRLLIGGSVAVAYVALLKLATHWIAPRQFALASGLALLVGIVGAVFAGIPLQLLVAEFGWRAVMTGSAIVVFGVGVAIWSIVRDDPHEKGYASYAHPDAPAGSPSLARSLRGVAQVFRYRNIQLLFLIPGAIVGSVLTFSGLWGVPFLTTYYGLPATQAAAICTTLLVSWAISGPILGALSDRIGRRKPIYVIGCGLVFLGWSIIIFVQNLPIPLLVGLIIGTGIASGCMVITYAYGKESAPPSLAGTVSGVCNMGVMLGPMVLQPAVGWMLDQRWQGQMLDGVRIYGLEAYQAGFSLMLAWAGLAFMLTLFTQETHCQQMVGPDRIR